MSIFMILFLVTIPVAFVLLVMIAMRDRSSVNYLLPPTLFVLFAAFTTYTIAQEGVLTVVSNHTVNFWGVQVWYDLLISVAIALFFIAPRARKAGMSIPIWVVFVGLTASIGLLAMVARMFWLESKTA